MTRKNTTIFNLDRAIDQVSNPSIFDRLVKEIDAKIIPSRYIDHVLVQFHDGNVIELSGEDITFPIPLNKSATWATMENSFKKMKDIKVFININTLEIDINEQVEKIIGPHC